MNNGIEVNLLPYEMEMASYVGVKRHTEALKNGRPDRHGFDGDGMAIHIEGAMGEMAFSKAAGIYWEGSYNVYKDKADVGPIEVRTRSNDNYDLIVRENDKDKSIFVLVTGKEGRYVVRGWISGKSAKKEKWLKEHGGRPAAYFVPQQDLRPPNELIERLLLSRSKLFKTEE